MHRGEPVALWWLALLPSTRPTQTPLIVFPNKGLCYKLHKACDL